MIEHTKNFISGESAHLNSYSNKAYRMAMNYTLKAIDELVNQVKPEIAINHIIQILKTQRDLGLFSNPEATWDWSLISDKLPNLDKEFLAYHPSTIYGTLICNHTIHDDSNNIDIYSYMEEKGIRSWIPLYPADKEF